MGREKAEEAGRTHRRGKESSSCSIIWGQSGRSRAGGRQVEQAEQVGQEVEHKQQGHGEGGDEGVQTSSAVSYISVTLKSKCPV